MTHLIRGTVLHHVSEVIAEAGGDPDALLRAHRIDPAATGDFERFVVYEDAAAVLGDAARSLDCPDLGLRLGLRQNEQILGPLGVILRNAETIGDALGGVCRFIRNVAPVDTVELIRTRQFAVYTYDASLRNSADRHQMVEKSLAVAIGTFRWMLGADFVPLRVTFRHPRLAPAERYAEVFGRPVDFDDDRNSMHLSLPDLERPVPGRDAAALMLAENHLTRIRAGMAVVEHVREITRRQLIVNQTTLVAVAAAMWVHPRALQRRLADEGTTFEALLDDVRKTAAWELSAAGVPVTQIARELGYSEQSSYSRACRRWYAESPRQLAARIRRGEPGPRNTPAGPDAQE